MPEVIDAFSHVLPQRFLDEMSDIHPTKELSSMSEADHLIDVDNRVGDMDDFGIDRQVMTLARPTIWPGIDRDVAHDAIRLANETVREAADEYPDRLIPVGTIPLLHEEYIPELEYCVNELDMPGVQIFSNIEGKPLDAPEFRAFWEAVEDLDATVWIHPQLHPWHDWANEYMDHKLFGWPFDTTLAMARLVWSGIMDEHDPDIVTHHMGGMVSFYGERIARFYDKRITYRDMYPDTHLPEFEDGVQAQFRKFYGDTAVSGSAAATACGREFFGSDQLVFGADYPFGTDGGRVNYEVTLPMLEDLDAPDSVKNDILGGNVKELL